LILSSGRTGTQFLAHYFDANYAGVVARHEPPPTRWLRLASHARMVGALSDERLRALLAYTRRHYGPPADADLYVESNPFLAGSADLLAEVWGDPTIIHVVRDPRDHARSSLNHGTASGLKGLANRFIPYGYPNVRRILALDHRPSPLENAAGLWGIINERLCSAAPLYSDYHRLAYERVFDASHSGLREICGILGLVYREAGAAVAPSERVNRSHLDVLPHWRKWSRAQCRALHAICSPLMQQLGYGQEPEWLERVLDDE
jgi:glycine/D-amino acid oxidase-like deaminating enzyme